MTIRVSLAELAAADIQLDSAEAVAVVVEICRQYSSGRIRGLPSPGVIRLTRDGAIVAEGPLTTGAESGVRRAAHLLSDLLPDFDAPAAYRAGGGLRLVVARALGTIDPPPYATLEELCGALAGFSVEDLGTTVRGLFRAWESRATRRPAGTPSALTISDIRRARRATGLSLDELAAIAEVPAARLRELECGYLRNWKLDDAGRAQVIRYARAAGLDEAVVLSIAWPMIEEEAAALRDGPPETVVALVPSGPQTLALASPIVRGRRSRSRLVSWAGAAAAAASLALATFGLVTWTANDGHSARVATTSESAVATPAVPSAAAALPAAAPQQPAARHPAAPRRAAPRQAASRQAARPAHASARHSSSRTRSFLEKELFRIVIR